MNENHSRSELIYRARWVGADIKKAIQVFPVVVISGARQVGKSTFLQNEFRDFRYVSLDDFSAIQQARADPASLWINTDRVILDEVQKAPELLKAVKRTVDGTKRAARFLLSGSSNLLLMKNVGETLAGRAVYFEMLPMAYGEMEGSGHIPRNFFNLWKENLKEKEQSLKPIDPVPLMLRGFMPPVMALRGMKEFLLWWEGYVRTYLERDVRELSRIDSLIDFRSVLGAFALRTANLLNQTEVSRDTGVSQPTVYRYLKLLEVSNIVERIPAYYSSRTKRLTKSPKLFFFDPGLSIYLSGYHDEDSLRNSREIGSYFETMIHLHLKILSELMVPKGKLFFWRASSGREVDFVIEHGRKLLAIEAKLTRNPVFQDARNLLAFLNEHPGATRAVLVHAGNSVQWLHAKILAVPWQWLCL